MSGMLERAGLGQPASSRPHPIDVLTADLRVEEGRAARDAEVVAILRSEFMPDDEARQEALAILTGAEL